MKKKNYQNNYPTMLIHGFVGWGANDGINSIVPYFGFRPDRNVVKYLTKKGFEVYSPSVGPFNSAWDRACELYAQIVGGTVDYGKVHSEKYKHERYGRTYDKPLIPDWGKNADHAKINIVGHSFGGPTVTMFAELMAHGAKEEIEGTPANELSGLFKGGQADMLHTVTTLSGVNNGTTFASFFDSKKLLSACTYLVLMLNSVLSETQIMKMYDFHTQHWGVMDVPKNIKGNRIRSPFKDIAAAKRYDSNNIDSIAYEMTVETCHELHERESVDPGIYYFARVADRTHRTEKGNYELDKGSFFLCMAAGHWTGKFQSKKLEAYGVDETWFPNDGFVNVKGQLAPDNQPQTDWVDEKNVKPGIWYNMPTEYKDHMSWTGYGEKRGIYLGYFERMLQLFRSLPDG